MYNKATSKTKLLDFQCLGWDFPGLMLGRVLTTELAPAQVLVALLAYRQTHTNVDYPKPAILVLTVRHAPPCEEATLEEV